MMESTETIIEAGRGIKDYWKDLWRYRELLYFLAWRDILVRYKQTAMGVLWSLLRPVATMAVFTVVFGLLAKFPSEGVPYPLFVFAGMLPWQFFAASVTEIGNSLVAHGGIITKVYFPRLIVPISPLIVCFIDFCISLGLMLLILPFFAVSFRWQLFTLPLFIALAASLAWGLGLWVASLNVRFRDFRFLVPFLMQLGLYMSPVGFSTTIIPQQWRFLYSMNPMVGVIDGFRWALFGSAHDFSWHSLIFSCSFSLFLTISGVWFFRKMERTMADTV